MPSPLVCTACLGMRRVTLQDDPPMTQTCSHCGGQGDEPCSAPGCEFSAVMRVNGVPLCEADATLLRASVRV